MGRIRRRLVPLTRYYHLLAVICFNSLLLFAVINLVADAALHAKEYFEKRAAMRGTPWAYKGYQESLTAVYPGLTREQISGLIGETRKLAQGYDVYTQFKENPYAGEYVRVDPRGFRLIGDQKPWPPRDGDYVVFIFGGSTTFGYGLTDDLTLASHVQKVLASDFGVSASVYNFGRGAYFSVQERLLFEKLLLGGFRPHMAIFVDGLNDLTLFDGKPAYTRDLRRLMEEGDVPLVPKVVNALPVVRAVTALCTSHEGNKTDIKEFFKKAPPDQQARLLQRVIERYKVNKRITEAISREFDIIPIFVWQPVPVYKYDGQYNIFGGYDYESQFPALKPGYDLMRKALESHAFGPNFIWAADTQENLQKPLYVDAVHYSGEMSKILAKHIVKTVTERGLDARFHPVIPHQQIGYDGELTPHFRPCGHEGERGAIESVDFH